jgi:dTDP-glucose 4,6-dehydratase
MATCLVTGGSGFLGSHLCDHLLAKGHRVICVDNLETGNLGNIAHIPDSDKFRFVQADITSHYEIDESVDFVYHMASPASPIDYARLPLHTLKVGAYGTHNTLGLAKAKRARFLLASTSEVYGDPEVHPQKETYWGNVNPIGPRGVYDEAKRYAEAMTMAYMRQQGVDTAIVRIFNTYGPRMRPHDGRAIPTFLRQALTEKPVTVFGDGSQTRSFCFVDDLVRGLIALMESGVHEPVNIGNPNEMTLLEMAGRRPEGAPARHLARASAARVGAAGRAARGTAHDDRPRDVAAGQAGLRHVVGSEAKNLEAISRAIDQHNRDCPFPAVAVAMNPFEVERLGWDEIRGLPVRSDPNVGTGSFRIVCGGDEGGIEEEEREVVEAVSEQVVPLVE